MHINYKINIFFTGELREQHFGYPWYLHLSLHKNFIKGGWGAKYAGENRVSIIIPKEINSQKGWLARLINYILQVKKPESWYDVLTASLNKHWRWARNCWWQLKGNCSTSVAWTDQQLWNPWPCDHEDDADIHYGTKDKHFIPSTESASSCSKCMCSQHRTGSWS